MKFLFYKKFHLTNPKKHNIIKIQKGKTLNGYAKVYCFKNNALLGGGRYFFMDIINNNKSIIKIMYCSISYPPFLNKNERMA